MVLKFFNEGQEIRFLRRGTKEVADLFWERLTKKE
jgi:hypothetical protein